MGPHAGLTFCKKVHNDTYDAIDPVTKSNLSGKVVLVTGANKGVGRATAISLAKAGAEGIAIAARKDLKDVEAAVRNAAREAGKPEPKILALNIDVTSRDDVEKAAEEFGKTFDRLDVLINNAGYIEHVTRIADSDPEDWWYSFDVNVKGTYLMARSFLPILLKGGDKTIMNVSSVGAHIIGAEGSAYKLAKMAVLRLGEFINVEYGDQGVVSYGIHPGGIQTELGKKFIGASSSPPPLNDTPEIAADTIVFLISQKRDWLAGRYISCCWDMPEFMGKKDEVVKGDKLKIRLQDD